MLRVYGQLVVNPPCRVRVVAPGVTGEDLYRQENGERISLRRAMFNETRRKAGLPAQRRALEKRARIQAEKRTTSSKARPR